MNNRFYIVRHGHSEANALELVVSKPEVGTVKYGLTEKGKKQVQATAAKHPLGPETIIYSSDFLRARESAEILKKTWNCREVLLAAELRERFFGDFDGSTGTNYEKVWALDKTGGNHAAFSIESPAQVAERVSRLLTKLDKTYKGKTIVLVSHGDSLQILQAVRAKLPPSEHRSLPHLENAEIREV